jgi:hypothetical protein
MAKNNDMVKTFMDKGYVVNNDLTNSSYVTLEDDKYSIYVSYSGELAWENFNINTIGADQFFRLASE